MTVPHPPVWRAEDWREERVRVDGFLVLRETVRCKWKMILPLPWGEEEGIPVTKTTESETSGEWLSLGLHWDGCPGEIFAWKWTGWSVPVTIWVGDLRRDSRRETGGSLLFHCLVAKMIKLTVGHVGVTTESSQVWGILLSPWWWPPGNRGPVTRSFGWGHQPMGGGGIGLTDGSPGLGTVEGTGPTRPSEGFLHGPCKKDYKGRMGLSQIGDWCFKINEF